MYRFYNKHLKKICTLGHRLFGKNFGPHLHIPCKITNDVAGENTVFYLYIGFQFFDFILFCFGNGAKHQENRLGDSFFFSKEYAISMTYYYIIHDRAPSSFRYLTARQEKTLQTYTKEFARAGTCRYISVA